MYALVVGIRVVVGWDEAARSVFTVNWGWFCLLHNSAVDMKHFVTCRINSTFLTTKQQKH